MRDFMTACAPFARYQASTQRQIPLLMLKPVEPIEIFKEQCAELPLVGRSATPIFGEGASAKHASTDFRRILSPHRPFRDVSSIG